MIEEVDMIHTRNSGLEKFLSLGVQYLFDCGFVEHIDGGKFVREIGKAIVVQVKLVFMAPNIGYHLFWRLSELQIRLEGPLQPWHITNNCVWFLYSEPLVPCGISQLMRFVIWCPHAMQWEVCARMNLGKGE